MSLEEMMETWRSETEECYRFERQAVHTLTTTTGHEAF